MYYFHKNSGNAKADYFITTNAVDSKALKKELKKAKIKHDVKPVKGKKGELVFQFEDHNQANRGQSIIFKQALVKSQEPVEYALKHKLIPKKVGEQLLEKIKEDMSLPTPTPSKVVTPPKQKKVQERKPEATKVRVFKNAQALSDLITKGDAMLSLMDGIKHLTLDVDVTGRKVRWTTSKNQVRTYWCAIENINKWFNIEVKNV